MNTQSYALIACHVLWRELSFLIAQSPSKIFPVFLEQGLHNEPDRLRRQVQEAIDRLDGQYDAILIGYGLCSNGICGLHTRKSRLVAIRAHDCITLLLGSKQHYQTYFDENPGTYWYTAGWIETGTMPGNDRIKLLHRQYTEKYDEETADYLIEEERKWMEHYRKACFIHQEDLPVDHDALRPTPISALRSVAGNMTSWPGTWLCCVILSWVFGITNDSLLSSLDRVSARRLTQTSSLPPLIDEQKPDCYYFNRCIFISASGGSHVEKSTGRHGQRFRFSRHGSMYQHAG